MCAFFVLSSTQTDQVDDCSMGCDSASVFNQFQLQVGVPASSWFGMLKDRLSVRGKVFSNSKAISTGDMGEAANTRVRVSQCLSASVFVSGLQLLSRQTGRQATAQRCRPVLDVGSGKWHALSRHNPSIWSWNPMICGVFAHVPARGRLLEWDPPTV